MPKTNDATGATYDGYEGVVEHAGGRASTRYEEEALRGLSQLDPSRRVNGEIVEGFESEEREIEPREGSVAADFAEVHPVQDKQDEERSDEDSDNTVQDDNRDESPSEDSPKGGEQSSDGNSSTTSSRSSATATKASRAKSR